ncbi:MAG: hydrogenase maturation protease [Elusimicrobiota bacterium]
MDSRTVVAGLGNPLMGDDGAGIAVLKELQKRPLPGNTVLLDAGTDGLKLASFLSPSDKAILVDAVRMGKPAGSVHVFRPEQADLRPCESSLSGHSLGLSDTLKLLALTGGTQDITIVGIEPERIASWMGLSPVVEASVSPAVDRVLELISPK